MGSRVSFAADAGGAGGAEWAGLGVAARVRAGPGDRAEVGHAVPILIRLADRGLVEACWQDEPAPGRPRRHLYRLTANGLASATTALAEAELAAAERAGSTARPGASPRRGRGSRRP